MADLGGKNRAFARVATLVERDCHLFATEHGCLQECFRVPSIVCFDDESAVSWSFYVLAMLSTDSSDLLLRPENVNLPEREVAIGSLNNQKGAVERQVRFEWRAINRITGRCVGQVRARVRAPGVVGGRARVMAPGEVGRRARVRVPGGVRGQVSGQGVVSGRARVGTG